MSEGNDSRVSAANENRNGLNFAERARVIVVGVLASALLAGVMFATVAQGGSGGVGSPGSDGGKLSQKQKYERIWKNFSRKNKRWARRTSECESGGNRRIHGGGGTYHGAFQFMKSTWKSAPRSVGNDPHKKPWKTQAVVAVKLKQRDGAKTHWPNCG